MALTKTSKLSSTGDAVADEEADAVDEGVEEDAVELSDAEESRGEEDGGSSVLIVARARS